MIDIKKAETLFEKYHVTLPDLPEVAMRRLLDELSASIAVSDALKFEGRIRFFELPGDTTWTETAFKKQWPKLFADKRKRENLLVYETENLLTAAGRAQLLTYIGSTSGTSLAFAQYFAIGTGGIITVSPGDNTVIGEVFRVVPSTATITGNITDLQSIVGNAQAVGTWTSCGLFGNNATGSSGTGTLYTHALIASFVKDSSHSYAIDYQVAQN